MKNTLFRGELDKRLHSLLPNCEFRRMTTWDDIEAVRCLREEGYRKSFPGCEGWFGFDDYSDQGENTATFGVFIAGRFASTVRLTVITNEIRRSQAMDLYSDTLSSKLDNGKVLLEVSRLVVNPNMADQIPELPYLTFRMVAMGCQHYGVDETISAVRTRHVPFYRRMFGGRSMGETVWYEPFQSEIALVTFPLNAITDDLSKRYSSWLSSYLERRTLFGRADLIPGISEEYSLAA